MITHYRAGKISIQPQSTILTGHGTRWLNYVTTSSTVEIDQDEYTAEQILDHHQIRLTTPYTGPAIDQHPYRITIQPTESSLDDHRRKIHQQIDWLAGKTRLNYITQSPGQEATYLSKYADAQAYATAGYPTDATPYPWINAEAAATHQTPATVAQQIIAAATLWTSVGSQIEAARQAAKRTIKTAQTQDAMQTAYQQLQDTLSSLE